MKHQRHGILTLLFGLTALLCFASLAQQHLELFEFKGLHGYLVKAEKPDLTFEALQNGSYQCQSEAYLKENFGFREPLIRWYNQYLYDLFKTTTNHDVAIEKDGWLYHTDHTYQYFGQMEQKTKLSYDEVRDNLTLQAECLSKVKAILEEYGVHLLTFTLPTKTYIYPEHLRWHPVGDTTFNAAEFWERQQASYGIPHIDMTPWFRQMQDTCPFDLFYSKGSHWAAGAVLAVDSLLNYMEQLGGQPLTRLELGLPYAVDSVSYRECDLEQLLNLARPLPHEPQYEYPVSYVSDGDTRFPTVLFIGTSFYWHMSRRVNFSAIFRSRDFQYYSSLYYYNRESMVKPMEDIDPLRELLLHDYVVLFRDGPQLYDGRFCYPAQWLESLCGNDNLEELLGNGVPTARNPRIPKLLAEKRICSSRTGRFLFQAQLENDSTQLDRMTDQVFFTTYDYFSFLVDETVNELCRYSDTPVWYSVNNPMLNETFINQAIDTIGKRIRLHVYDDDSLMWRACAMNRFVTYLDNDEGLALLRQKADNKRISIDKAFREEVVWMVNHKEDLRQYVVEDVLLEAFENYQVERKLRRYPPSMDNILAKYHQMDIPLRIILNRDILWIKTSNSNAK